MRLTATGILNSLEELWIKSVATGNFSRECSTLGGGAYIYIYIYVILYIYIYVIYIYVIYTYIYVIYILIYITFKTKMTQ